MKDKFESEFEAPVEPEFHSEPVVEVPAGCGNCSGTGLVKNGWKVDEQCPVCQGKGK